MALRSLGAGAVYVEARHAAVWLASRPDCEARLPPAVRAAAAESCRAGHSRLPPSDADPGLTLLAAPLRGPDGELLGACCAWDELRVWSEEDEILLRDLADLSASELAAQRRMQVLEEDAVVLDVLNRTGARLGAELDLNRLVQLLTDAGTELSGAQFGAFFYNVLNPNGEAYTLYTLSGVPREAFSRFPMPRNTQVFDPTFRGEGVIRLDDVTRDRRYGHNPPYQGMPEGHLPVRSYLALPVISRTGEVLGGLFFGHEQAGVFKERHERILVGLAAQAAVAIDNARLYEQTVASQQRFEDLVNGLEAIFWEADARTFQFTFVSAQAEAILGYPAERWLSQPDFWVNILHPADRHWAPEFCLRETQGGRDHTFEYRALAADGREVWLRDIVYVVPDEGGCPARLRGLMLDISERKEAEARQALQHGVTRVLAGSRTLDQAAPDLLAIVGQGIGWSAGNLWIPHETGDALRCCAAWTHPDLPSDLVRRASAGAVFSPGQGLPGRVWTSGKPLWISDLSADESFTRTEAVRQSGLQAALAVPICLGERPVAVLEFFRADPTAPGDAVLEAVEAIAGEISHFLERARAETALRASEERLRLALEAGQLGAWDWDAVSGTVTWSEELERLHGLDPGSFPGTFDAVQRDMHPEDRERVLASISNALAGKGDHHVEYRIILPDGVQRWVLGRGNVKRDGSGAPTGMSGVCMDITARKEAEQALRFLAEASATLASSLDYETTLSSVARLAVPTVADWCAVDLLGPEGAIRRLAVAHVDPEKVRLAYELEERYPMDPAAPQGIPAVLRTGRPELVPVIPHHLIEEGARDEEHRRLVESLGLKSYLVVPLIARDQILGSLAFVSAESGRVFGEEDLAFAQELARRAAMAIDNAQLYRESEERRALEMRRARQAALVADVGVALNRREPLDDSLQQCADAVVRHLDAAFARIWTLQPEAEVLELRASAGLYTHLDGKHSRIPVGAYKIGRIAEERQPHLTNDVQHDPRVSDQEWARREGMLAFAGYPLVVEDRVVGVLALFSRRPLEADTLEALSAISDVVAQGIERKRTEREIRALNATLERRVRDRTAKLSEANRELESFSYSVSHDLRAPLRHIAGFADLLRKRSADRLDENAARYLSTIQESARHAGNLVDDLLAFSRMGRAEMRSEVVNLDQLADEALRDLETEIADRPIQWVRETLGHARGDAAMLRLVLRNLFQNAVKYTRPQEHARIEIGTIPRAEEKVIYVRDNGVGFDMRYVDKLFGVFQRLHANEQFEGTGIGLANVRRIINRHGGHAWAEGEVGRGATFYFSLPEREDREETNGAAG